MLLLELLQPSIPDQLNTTHDAYQLKRWLSEERVDLRASGKEGSRKFVWIPHHHHGRTNENQPHPASLTFPRSSRSGFAAQPTLCALGKTGVIAAGLHCGLVYLLEEPYSSYPSGRDTATLFLRTIRYDERFPYDSNGSAPSAHMRPNL